MSGDSAKLSFERDIRPMFTSVDVDHMVKVAGLNLADRDSVFAHAEAIYATVSAGSMPPASSGEPRWTPQMCAAFQRWKEEGGLP
ncbi:MAG: hypothetical protein JO060_10005 [Candidatus Eremiobacteraeota bacterium]|nr:hypothetical protein [Candidatus Eremiobacteraeota bacterium]